MSRTLRQRRLRHRRAAARRRSIVLGIGIAGAIAVIGGGYGLYLYVKDDRAYPSIRTLKPGMIGQNSIIYDADGNRMGIIQSDRNRQVIPLRKMSPYATSAIVSIEDRRFYRHNGVDPEGIARAAMRNLEAGSTVEGASTITQQVVRNLYPEVTRERTLRRKVKEATLAYELENRYSKKWILSKYLNLVFFGNNAYGIEAASQTYFSRHAGNLDLPQAALLAGLPQEPSTYDPFHNPAAALRRRNQVLDAMYRDRSITEREYRAAVATPIRLKAGRIYRDRRLPYFFDYVKGQLKQQYGATVTSQGGLRVQTTIKPRLQRLAESAIRETLNQPGDPSAAMVVLDTQTGEIRAMASSEDYGRTQFNRAADARRQPGSTAKIWVLASFLKANVNPDTTSYTSRPFGIRYKGATEWWTPKTYDGSYGGTRSIRSATVASDNSVYAQMTLDITPEAVSKTAHQMGISSSLENVWSIGLGSQVVTPLEQTNFYSTIARGGVRKSPVSITHVTGPGGSTVKLSTPAPRRVMADWQAMKIVDILHDNMTGGTGTGAYVSRHGPNQAGKTGTTDDHKDAWFCGMTPELTACVWMGFNIPTPMYSVHGISVAGGTFPATMWRRFMDPALDIVRRREWFSVTGKELWLPFSSTWQTNPAFDIQIAAVEDPKDKDKDKKDKDSKRDDAGGGAATPDSGTTKPAPGGGTPTPPGGGTPDPGGGAGGGTPPPAGAGT